MNYNSLLIGIIVNIFYIIFFGLITTLALVFADIINVNKEITCIVLTAIFTALCVFKFNNYKTISLFYKIKNYLKNNIEIIQYKAFSVSFKIFFPIIVIYTLFCCLNCNSSEVNADYTIVNITITIATFAVTLIFALIQYLCDKFSDFDSVLKECRKNVYFMFFAIIIYLIIAYISLYFSLDFATWIFVTSIYLIVELFFLVMNSVVLFNHKVIVKVKRMQIIDLITKIPQPIILKEQDKEFKKLIKPKKTDLIIKFLHFHLIGIFKEKNNENFIEYFNKEIKKEIEILFRVASLYVEQDKIVLYKSTLQDIMVVTKKLISSTQGINCFSLYEFLIFKLNDLLDKIEKYNREEYLDDFEKCISCLIFSTIEASYFRYNKASNETELLHVVDFYKKFIIRISHYMHSTTVVTAIDNLRIFAHELLYKSHTMVLQELINSLVKILETIETKKIAGFWFANLIYKMLICNLNVLFYIILSGFDKKYDFRQEKLFKIAAASFMEIFTKFDKYSNTLFDFSSALYNLENISFNLYQECIKRNYKIKTPYKNLILNRAIKPIEKVASLYELTSVVLLWDFEDSVSFKKPIQCLLFILESLKFIKRTEDNYIYICNLTNFYMSLLDNIKIFIKRARFFDFNLNENLLLIKILIEKISEVFFINYKNLYLTDDFDDKFAESLIVFCLFDKEYHNFLNNNEFEKLIENIIKMFNEEQEKSNKETIFKLLKSLHAFVYIEHQEACVCNILLDFVLKNNKDFVFKGDMFPSVFEQNYILESFEHYIDSRDLLKYLNYIKDNQK